jgi:hypothetical protein
MLPIAIQTDVLLTTNSFNGSGGSIGQPLLLKGYLPSAIDIWSLKSDYTQPLKNGRFEAGVKSSLVTNNNHCRLYQADAR